MRKGFGAFVSVLMAGVFVGDVLPAQGPPTPQEHVHHLAHRVMPFDLSQTIPIFQMTEQGGLQRVVTRAGGASD